MTVFLKFLNFKSKMVTIHFQFPQLHWTKSRLVFFILLKNLLLYSKSKFIIVFCPILTANSGRFRVGEEGPGQVKKNWQAQRHAREEQQHFTFLPFFSHFFARERVQNKCLLHLERFANLTFQLLEGVIMKAFFFPSQQIMEWALFF